MNQPKKQKESNIILAFDTSNAYLSAAISRNATIIAYDEVLQPKMQAEKLIPTLEKLLLRTKLNYTDIDFVASCVGPGSFTGIRTGLAAAKAIARATGAIEVAVNGFEHSYARALEQLHEIDEVVIILEAFRQQVYLQRFDKYQNAYPPSAQNYQDAIELIKRMPGVTIAGSGIASLYDHIKQLPINILPRHSRIKATSLCKIANDKINNNQTLPLNPLYIRPPDAKKPSNL